MELIQVAKRAGVDFENELHLLLVVEEVLYNSKNPTEKKPKKDRWSFR